MNQSAVSGLLMPTLEMERLAVDRMSELVKKRVGKESVMQARVSAGIEPTTGLTILLLAQALTIAGNVYKFTEEETAFVIDTFLPKVRQDSAVTRLDPLVEIELLAGVENAWRRLKNGLRRYCERHISEVY